MIRDHGSQQHAALHAVYNSLDWEMSPSLRVDGLLLCAVLLLSSAGYASDWQKPTSQLAGKIAAVTGPGVVAVEFANRSSLSSSDAEEIRRELISSLESSGVHVWQPDQASAIIKVTLSENQQNYVWVAEIQQGASDATVALLSLPRPESFISAQNALPLNLLVRPLISGPEPILDVAILAGSPQRMLALSANSVTIYDFKDGRWTSGQSLAVNHSHPFPRDVHGRIVPRKDHVFDAYLPGLVCHSTNSSPLSINCAGSDDPWPLQTANFGLSAFFSPTRNFFPGALVPGISKQKSAPQFYSAAALPKGNYVLWVFSGIDGQLHQLDGINQQTLTKVHWGSDLAGMHATCRQDWQVLATSPEGDAEDSLQAFEFPDREPVAVSQRVPLNGRVTALWSESAGDGAIAVYRNSETGNYEAVQLNLACRQ